VRQKVVDDVGPLALGNELARVIFRQELIDPVEDLAKPTGGAEPFQLLRQPAALALRLGKRDVEDRENWRALISAAAFWVRSKNYLPFLRLLISMMAGERAKERRQAKVPTNPPSSKPRSLDDLTCEEETRGIMKLAEVSLAEFLEEEPDIYTLKDLKVKYK